MNAVIWTLILFAHVGPMGDGNSNALATAEFNSEANCRAAGEAAKGMSSGSTKKILYVCARK